MTVIRSGDEILIKISKNADIKGIQRLINYINYNEVTANSKATQDDVNQLASEINKKWWEENKNRFLND